MHKMALLREYRALLGELEHQRDGVRNVVSPGAFLPAYGSFERECRPLLSEYTLLLRKYKALLRAYRVLLGEYRALLRELGHLRDGVCNVVFPAAFLLAHGSFDRECGALSREYTVLLGEYRALLRKYRPLLGENRALLRELGYLGDGVCNVVSPRCLLARTWLFSKRV